MFSSIFKIATHVGKPSVWRFSTVPVCFHLVQGAYLLKFNSVVKTKALTNFKENLNMFVSMEQPDTLLSEMIMSFG